MKRIKQAACTFSFLAITACGDMSGQDVQVDEPKQEISQVSQLLRAKRPIPGQYIVVLKDTAAQVGAESIGQEMALKHGGQVFHTYRKALNGFAIRMPEARVQQLLADDRVAYVEEDSVVEAIAFQSPATWGIDRTDQRALPLSNSYDNNNVTASNVHAYIIDTGVRLTHTEFSGRMGNGHDAVTTGGNANDCHGHGTHVAGTVAGTTYGLAKMATVHPVRVLDCQGSGTNAGVIAGMDWVAQNHIKPAVANMSLGGGASQAVDDAVTRMHNAGVVVAVAAGNDNSNACNYSPARAPAAITVGSTTNTDARSSFSNFGTCLDIFAPGSNITSAWMTNDTSTNTISGTSMASPHVAGVAALFLSVNPTASPTQVRDALVANATTGVVTSPGTSSPNVLLYSAFITGGGGGDTVAPTTSITAPTGGTLTGTVTFSADASDNVGVVRVDFLAGTTVVGSDTTAPYSISWNTTGVANASYSLTTKAYDANGNAGTSAAVSVTVNNPDTTPVLVNGTPVSNLSDATGGQKHYKLTVPAGQTSLEFVISGGTGDADLHVNFGARASTTTYTCRPYLGGNAETCTVANPQAGDWYVMLNAYAAYSGVTLKGTYGAGGGGGDTLVNGVASAAYSGASGSWKCWTLTVPANRAVTFNQAGGTGDADLYVRFGAAPTSGTYDCRPFRSGNAESCSLTKTTAGTYHACSYGYSSYTSTTMKGTY
jgi:subtilisin family serine protease